MSNIIIPSNRNYKHPYCRVCGQHYTSAKFVGKVIIAREAGRDGEKEIMFCEACAKTEEAQKAYRELTALDGNRIIHAG